MKENHKIKETRASVHILKPFLFLFIYASHTLFLSRLRNALLLGKGQSVWIIIQFVHNQLIAILTVTFDIVTDNQSLTSRIYLYLFDFLTAIDLGFSPSASPTVDF